MKKYIAPATEVLLIENQPVMAGSIDTENNKATLSDDFVTSGKAGEARRNSFWDED